MSTHPKTLRKYFRSQLDPGHTKVNAKVAENQPHIASPSPRVGPRDLPVESESRWKETSAHERAGSTGERQIDLSAWHDDILEAADEEARERSQAAAASAAAFLSRPHNGEACQAAIVRPDSFD